MHHPAFFLVYRNQVDIAFGYDEIDGFEDKN